MTENADATRQPEAGELPRNWGLLLALGLLNMVLGFIGLGSVIAFTLASVLIFAALLAVAGVGQLGEGLFDRDQPGSERFRHILIGALYLGIAMLVVAGPLAASAGLTMFIAVLLIFVGGARIGLSFRLRRAGGPWLWALVAGAAAILAGIVIISQWPVSGLWVLGLLLSLELILNGWLLTVTALAARVAMRQAQASAGG